MTAVELLSDLRARGIQVEANGDRLRINAPRGVLTPEMRDALVAYKAELLNILKHPSYHHFALIGSPVLGEPA